MMMTDRLRRAFLSTCFVALACVLAACASEPEQRDQQEQSEQQQRQAVEVEEPTPEEIANSPCGNPDWAQLPPGAEDKAVQPPQNAPAEGGDDAADEAGGDAQEQSNKADLSPSEQPCT